MTSRQASSQSRRKKKKRLRRRIDHILLKFVPPIAAFLLRLLYATFRTDPPRFRVTRLKRQCPQGMIMAFWHRVILPATYTGVNTGIRVMISEHEDGEYIAKAVKFIGVRPVRGSSTRGYMRAVREVLKENKAGTIFGITPDGPRGPRYEVQPGVVLLASWTGLPIICGSVNMDDCWVLPTWDKFVLPKPFARVRFNFSQPIYVPRKLTPEQIEDYRRRIREELIRLTMIKGAHD